MSEYNQYTDFLQNQHALGISNGKMKQAQTAATTLLDFVKSDEGFSMVMKTFYGVVKDLESRTNGKLELDAFEIYQTLDYIKKGVSDMPLLSRKVTELQKNVATAQRDFNDVLDELVSEMCNDMSFDQISEYEQEVDDFNSEILSSNARIAAEEKQRQEQLAYEERQRQEAEAQRLAREKLEQEKLKKNIFIGLGVLVLVVLIIMNIDTIIKIIIGIFQFVFVVGIIILVLRHWAKS